MAREDWPEGFWDCPECGRVLFFHRMELIANCRVCKWKGLTEIQKAWVEKMNEEKLQERSCKPYSGAN